MTIYVEKKRKLATKFFKYNEEYYVTIGNISETVGKSEEVVKGLINRHKPSGPETILVSNREVFLAVKSSSSVIELGLGGIGQSGTKLFSRGLIKRTFKDSTVDNMFNRAQALAIFE